jgi:hypothetical protein
MAYMSQEKKAKIAPVVKAILKKYGMKGSLAVNNHSTLVLNIKSGCLDLIRNYNQTVGERPGGFQLGSSAVDSLSVNPYWFQDHFSGKAKAFLTEIFKAMNAGNHDNSDIQTDYFDVGWYVNVNVGRWNKPYVLEN